MMRLIGAVMTLAMAMGAIGCGKDNIVSSQEGAAVLSKPIGIGGTDTDGSSSTLGDSGPGDPVRSARITGADRRKAVVSVRVTQGGLPVIGAEVAMARSVSGRPAQYLWSGITGPDGDVVIEITEDSSGHYLRSGASGYYSARITNPLTEEILGVKNSIPIRGGESSEVFLELSRLGRIGQNSDLMMPEAVRVDASQNGTQVSVGANQVVVVTLDSNPSTGYSWHVVSTEGSVVRQLGVTEFLANSELLGAPGKEVLQFASTATGEGTLELVYKRRGEEEEFPQESFRVLIVSEGVGDGQISDPLILVPGPKDDDEEPVNPKAPDIRGTITDIRQALKGSGPSVLIESGDAVGNGIDKAWVSISRETKLLETSGEDFVSVSPTSLAVGQLVEVIFDGPVMESYPVQARARQLVVLK